MLVSETVGEEKDSVLRLIAVDHLVLPVESLTVVRERLTSLGFTVAPDGIHPFGTANACVFFSDGTYLEPLVVNDPSKAEQAELEGNSFVQRDRLFRGSGNREGFSAMVLQSADAQADHARFEQDGMSGGPRLDFSRASVSANGESTTASFRLAFADLASPRFFAFTCERVNAALPTSGDAVEHPNGVTSLSGISLQTSETESLERLSRFFGISLEWAGSNKSAVLDNCTVIVRTAPARLGAMSEVEDKHLSATGICLRVRNLGETANFLRARSINFVSIDDKLVVEPCAGQGFTLEFVA